MPHKSQLDDALAERVHAAGLKLATWVVDEPEELKQLARLGLYGVGSNRPACCSTRSRTGCWTRRRTGTSVPTSASIRRSTPMEKQSAPGSAPRTKP